MENFDGSRHQVMSKLVIDLQKGIATGERYPYFASDVVKNAAAIADASRKNGMPVFLVHVAPSPDGRDALHPRTSLI